MYTTASIWYYSKFSINAKQCLLFQNIPMLQRNYNFDNTFYNKIINYKIKDIFGLFHLYFFIKQTNKGAVKYLSLKKLDIV